MTDATDDQRIQAAIDIVDDLRQRRADTQAEIDELVAIEDAMDPDDPRADQIDDQIWDLQLADEILAHKLDDARWALLDARRANNDMEELIND